jgi:hypothetical protein
MRMRILVHASLLALVCAACSGSSESTGTAQGALTGPVEVRAAINPNLSPPLQPEVDGLTQIVVTIARIEAKVDRDDRDSWVTVVNGPRTIDLLSLQGASFASLGIGQLPGGETDALRLVIDDAGSNYVVTATGQTLPLVIGQATIRVAGDFDEQPCAAGFLTLEFAGKPSIELRTDGAFVLRPVIRLRDVEVSGSCPEREGEGKGEGEGDRDHGHGER